jgi:Biotin-protein ligase, N terminal
MKPTIALFLHQPKCSVQSGNGIMQALHTHYHFKIFTKHQLEDDFFDDVDIVAVPGGIGDADSYKKLLKYGHARSIRNFVANGGRYLGICMGAYWAGKHYLDILNEVDAVQYIKRPHTDTRRPHAKNLAVTWKGVNTNMFFYDGCAIVGNRRKFTTVSTYANGDAMAGFQGRIGLIGCHPEAEKHWYDEYSWMRRHWRGRQHHALLLDFVNQLMKR